MAKEPANQNASLTKKKHVKRLALVVHGIGEQREGESVDALVGGVAGSERVTTTSDRRLIADEFIEAPRITKSFPCHIRRVNHLESGDTTTFAEVYWADLSSAATTKINTIVEFLKLVLGLGYVIRDNTAERAPGAIPLALSRMFVWLIHGPILASNIANMLMLIAYFGIKSLYDAQEVALDANRHDTSLAIIGVAAVLIAFRAVIRQSGSGYLMQRFITWLAIMGMINLCFLIFHQMFLSSGHSYQQRIDWFTNMFAFIQFGAWLFAIALCVIMTLWQGVLDVVEGSGAWKKTLYPYTASLITLVAMLTSTIVWAAVLLGIVGYQSRGAVFSFGDIEKVQAVTKGHVPSAAIVDLLSTLTPNAAISANDLKFLNTLAVVGTGGIWPALILLVSAIVAVLIVRIKPFQGPFGTEHARLIVHPFMIAALAVIPFILLLFIAPAFLNVVACSNVLWTAPCESDYAMLAWLEAINAYTTRVALTVGGVMIVVYPFIWKSMAGLVGTGKDIVSYFAVARKKHLKPDYTSPEKSFGTLPPDLDPNDDFRPLIQDKINGRFHTVLKQMVAAEDPDEILIFAHSQGTVVAFESLRDNALDNSGYSDKPCTLITMGAPLFHIYARYFPTRMEQLNAPLPCVSRWINIHRVDDYVGTYIVGADKAWPENQSVGKMGHLNYWSDIEVREIFRKLGVI